MTELEKLKIVLDFLADVSYQEESGVTYERVEKAVKELETEEMKDRAERAEAALAHEKIKTDGLNETLSETARLRDEYRKRALAAEAAISEVQGRALWFEKLLKAEDARRVGEMVLDRDRVLKTAYGVLDNASGPPSMLAFLAIRLYMESTGVAFDDVSPYKWK